MAGSLPCRLSGPSFLITECRQPDGYGFDSGREETPIQRSGAFFRASAGGFSGARRSASGLASADASLEAAGPLSEHVPLLHRTLRGVLRLASPTGALLERPPFLVDRACVRRVVDGKPRAASLDPTDTAGRIGWAWA